MIKQQTKIVSRPCPACKGSGKIQVNNFFLQKSVFDKCPRCKGTGQVKVEIKLV